LGAIAAERSQDRSHLDFFSRKDEKMARILIPFSQKIEVWDRSGFLSAERSEHGTHHDSFWPKGTKMRHIFVPLGAKDSGMRRTSIPFR